MTLPDAAFLHHLADIADAETMPRYRTDLAVNTKPKEGYTFDPVTEADREAEIAIRAAIGERVPAHAVLGEEMGLTGSGRYRWVLDPVDGTRPFICGLPVWGTLIGLTVDGRAELGMMSQPFTRERFWADRNGAWTQRDGARQRLSTRDVGSLDQAMIAAGRIDLAIEPSLQPYDIVALIPIIERAGGVVTRLDGTRAEEGGAVLVAATAALHAAALRELL